MKFVKWALVAGYILFILTQTILFRSTHPEPIFKPLFWELQNGYWSDIWQNILLFMPLRFLIGGWKGVVGGFLVSCSIETVQYFTRLGFCEFDDVLNNTIGAGFGAILLHTVRKCLKEK